MASKSKIEWTDATWNPVSGCTKISPGCDHCYAENIAERFAGTTAYPNGFEMTLRPNVLRMPLYWKKPRRVFVNSMSDLFHDKIPLDYLDQVVDVMREARQHNYQVLTKRSSRMREYWNNVGARQADFKSVAPVPEHIWLGVSVEAAAFKFRIDHLRDINCAVRFLSLEPLLGPLGLIDLTGISWVIVGGESGHGARPMHPAWVREIRDQCIEQDVPFFFKQWGEWQPYQLRAGGDLGGDMRKGHVVIVHPDGKDYYEEAAANIGKPIKGTRYMERVGKKLAGRLLDGREWNDMPKLLIGEGA